MCWKLTITSDLHNKYPGIESLPGGDIFIISGDMTSIGSYKETDKFCKWFNDLSGYTYKIFIAGNHDLGFENSPKLIRDLVSTYSDIIYLQDQSLTLEKNGKTIKIWGSPYTPYFNNWAFNIPRGSDIMVDKWNEIPEDTDILITHGPPYGILDIPGFPHMAQNLGCEILLNRILEIKPKIHIFGHIHGGYGYINKNSTHFINASILNENYSKVNKVINANWESETNEIRFKI